MMNAVKSFLRDERGNQAVEAVLITPLLFWAFVATFSYYYTFKAHSLNTRAAYTIGDMLSRAEAPVDQAYLDGLNKAFDLLTQTSEKTSIRVSVVSREVHPQTGQEINVLVWSRATRGRTAYQDVEAINDKIPAIALGDQMIVVETFTDYKPRFVAAMFDHTIYNISFTRPRFMPQLPFSA